MAAYKEIWDRLSAVDVSKKVEKKMGLSYLSWAWAWGVLMQNYPDATYVFHDVITESDGSATVSVTVKIGECERMMWLPVMDHRNNAIPNPDSRKISDSKMRCLVKCLAMFGLGHYIYAGEDLPDDTKKDTLEKLPDEKPNADIVYKFADTITVIKENLKGLTAKTLDGVDLSTAIEAWDELTNDEKMAVWSAFTAPERAIMKTEEWKKQRGEK